MRILALQKMLEGRGEDDLVNSIAPLSPCRPLSKGSSRPDFSPEEPTNALSPMRPISPETNSRPLSIDTDRSENRTI